MKGSFNASMEMRALGIVGGLDQGSIAVPRRVPFKGFRFSIVGFEGRLVLEGFTLFR